MNQRSNPFRLLQPASLAQAGVPSAASPRAVAIGNFDGAHRGHAALVAAAREAVGPQGEVLALTFEPHPSRYFRPDTPHFRLMTPQLRPRLLAGIGFDGALVLPFDAELANLSADDFITRIVVGLLRADVVVVGQDFHFGHKRQGTPAFLAQAGERLGFRVILLAPVADAQGETVSSSAIRRALAAGDVARAQMLLGHPFSVSGTVIHGAKRGRMLGFPTANIALEPGFGLAHGVYAVRAQVGGVAYGGAANFGTRPQFDDGPPLLETFLLDFSGDLYGQTMDVTFVAWLRAEARFENLEALVAQMGQDCKKARELLAERAPA